MPSTPKTTRHLRARNCRNILERIRIEGPISAARLAEHSGLRPSTISNILKELRRQECIRYCGYGSSTSQGGKRPSLIELNPAFGLLVGMEAGRRQVRFVVRDFSLTEVFRAAWDVDADQGLERTIRGILGSVSKQFEGMRLLGVGIGSRSLPIHEAGQLTHTLAPELEREHGCPVVVDTHANLAACGEWVLEDGRSTRDLVYVDVDRNQESSSLELGFILDGRPYRGKGAAGHLSRGLSQVEGEETVESLVDLVIDLLDPSLIVLGTGLSEDIDFSSIPREPAEHPAATIRASRYGDYAAATGGVAVAFDEALEAML